MLRKVLIGLAVLAALAVAGAVVVLVGFSDFRSAQRARLTAGSKVAKTAKGPLEYALSGTGKRTILFVHGTPGGYDQGARLVARTEELGYRLLRVSRPGYLRTPLSTGKAPAEQADAYAALLDVLGIDKVSVLGISGGGPSSAEFAARHPGRCEALIMIAAISKPREQEESRTTAVEAFFRGTDFGAWLLWRGMHRNPAGSLARIVRDPAIRERIASHPDRLQAYLALADGALILPTLRAAGYVNDRHFFAAMPQIPLAAIRAPTLAVHGDKDGSVDIENAQHLIASVAGAELVKIEGGDHFISISHPDETFRPMFALLDRIGRAGQPAQATAAAAGTPPAAAPAP